MYTVYVLYSVRCHKIYIGNTSNIEERLKSHNELGKKGWTIKFRPWALIHTESFASKKEAMDREGQLKSAKKGKGIHLGINKWLSRVARRAHIRRSADTGFPRCFGAVPATKKLQGNLELFLK